MAGRLNLLVPPKAVEKLRALIGAREIAAANGPAQFRNSISAFIKCVAEGVIVPIGPLEPDDWLGLCGWLAFALADHPDAVAEKLLRQIEADANFGKGV